MYSVCHKVQWRYFSGVVDRFIITYVKFLPDSARQKSLNLWSYSNNKNVLLGHGRLVQTFIAKTEPKIMILRLG